MQVQFYNGPNIFGNFSEHTRTLRLYPRPVVALHVDSFLRSRPNQNHEFIAELCKTQAVEYFSECALCPRNAAYVRVQTGIADAKAVGDKLKWYVDELMPVNFNAYPSTESTLAEALVMASKRGVGGGDESDVEIGDGELSDVESRYSGMDECFSDSPDQTASTRSSTNFGMLIGGSNIRCIE